MKKNDFLQNLKEKLNVFDEVYTQQKILFYDEAITNLIKLGMMEEEAVHSLGNIDLIVKQIMIENHISLNYMKGKKKSFLVDKYEEFFKIINRVIDTMSKNSMNGNMKIIFDIFLLVVLTCIIKIPFILLRDLGENLLSFLNNSVVIGVWQFFIEIIYLVIAITFFVSIFKKWFKNLKIQK